MTPITFTLDEAALQSMVDAAVARALEERGVGATADDGWLRGADRIASYIDSPVSRVYAWREIGLPVEKDGSTLIACKADLDRWLRKGGGRRL